MNAKKVSKSRPVHSVGILTAGGDCPGLNAVIRAIGKTLIPAGVEVYGFLAGFTGLIENRYVKLSEEELSGLLTVGGTILRTSRDKPNKMPTPDGRTRDMTGAAIETYNRLNLDCLICLGGGGTQKNAYHLMKEGGINVVTAPKTIDNDVYGTDVSFGFDTGMTIAAEAIDRLHTTASSHHRVMVVDIMGNNSGWLALGAGVAGGADVILIPEIPYSMDVVSESLKRRMQKGKMFSIVAVAEGAVTLSDAEKKDKKKKPNKNGKASDHPKEPVSVTLAEHLEKATSLETRVTSLSHLQRGGIPTPRDRVLCTQFGVKAAELVLTQQFGRMVAMK
ncbi:MAG: ATP-dependent 6-phosphofructokinase, partial [Candidatus Omnitrophica bacterium]|nr:ATP-dependent 6-phosphofructokinase [Candidatus Omnitrophota bacterium]